MTNNSEFNLTVYCKLHFYYWENGSIGLSEIPRKCQNYSIASEIVIGIILGTLTILTAIGNFLIIISVNIVRRLQIPSNLLIVNLATSDLLVSLVVLPFAIIFQVKGVWPFSEFLCDLFILSDVLLCTSSILSLCIISIDRYFAITRPLQYAAKRTRSRMLIMIVFVWVLAALISVPPFIGWREPFVKGNCKYSDSLGYQIYATFGAFYLPLFIMLLLYGKILILARKLATLDTLNKSTHKCSNGDNENENVDSILTNNNQNNNKNNNTTNNDYEQNHHDDLRPIRRNRSQSVACNNDRKMRKYSLNTKRNTIGRLTLRLSINFYHKSRISSEVKAIKTLGVIMGCFTLCWCPFFIIQLFFPIAKALGYTLNSIPPTLIHVFLWLGYFNSFLNPLIYAKFNRDFRTPFQQIMTCGCRRINMRLRSESYVEQYGGNNFNPMTAGGIGGASHTISGAYYGQGGNNSLNECSNQAPPYGYVPIRRYTRVREDMFAPNHARQSICSGNLGLRR